MARICTCLEAVVGFVDMVLYVTHSVAGCSSTFHEVFGQKIRWFTSAMLAQHKLVLTEAAHPAFTNWLCLISESSRPGAWDWVCAWFEIAVSEESVVSMSKLVSEMILEKVDDV